MAIQRPFLVAVAAALQGLCSSCQQSPPAPPSASSAQESAVLTALREQQSRLVDELRALRLEVAALVEHERQVAADAIVVAPARDEAAGEAAAPLEVAQEAPAELLVGGAPAESPAESSAAPPAEPPASSARHWVAVAHKLVEESDFATAIRVLNVAAEVDPEYDDLYFERGVARHLLQGYAEAIDDFERAIARTARQDMRFICLYNQACALARLGRADEAIDKLEQSDAAGFRDLLESMSTDPDLDSLRDLPRFRDFLMQLRTR
ncbi:MAG: hypothetical protein JNL90_17630 [Planctomycetes bacterium]|nr:hypothetical protein [Planctomycetota bacterium]